VGGFLASLDRPRVLWIVDLANHRAAHLVDSVGGKPLDVETIKDRIRSTIDPTVIHEIPISSVTLVLSLTCVR